MNVLNSLLQDWSPEFMVYGDLGIHSDNIPTLISEARGGQYTAVLHVGDFAYNMEDRITPGELKRPAGIIEPLAENVSIAGE